MSQDQKNVRLLLHSMARRPRPGAKITVHMKDGRALACNATMVTVGNRSGIMIYHKRKAIDETKAVGWWQVILKPRENLDVQQGAVAS